MMRTRRIVGGLALVLALVAGACSSTSEPAATVADTSTDQVDETTEAAETTDSSTDEAEIAQTEASEPATDDDPVVADVFVSPIGEALGVSQDEFAQASLRYEQEAQELIRQCMANAGFDYEPAATGVDPASRSRLELESSLTVDQFTDQYGFGIATLFELNFQGEGVVEFADQQFGPAPTVARSSGEQAAYEMALNGETTQGLSPEEAQEQLFGQGVGNAAEGSCRATGYDTAENPGAVWDGLFSILGGEVQALTDRWESDPRVRAATTDWQACMAAFGHSYENRFELLNDLSNRANGLANEFLSSPQVLTALGQAQEDGFATMNREARYEFLDEVGALQGFSWVPDVQTEFDTLVDFEMLVASQSRECSDEEIFQQVQFELETEFVEEHGTQLALIASGDA